MDILTFIFLLASEILIHILNKKLSTEEQQLFHTINVINTEVVSSIVMKLDSISVCYGATSVSKFSNLKSSCTSQFEIVNGYWKHVNCLKILPENK